ncbi:MAG: pilus assembly protein [Anaerolineae bacterium]|nr:pilus assembly protein [Anaerolineae bacterium]MCI0610417.1 pilus assembly protein [Anaerolineae bacterium]
MKYTNSERGQSLVELAISIVILIYLLAGAVEFGIVFFQYVQLRDAAQEGALYGSMHPPADAAADTSAIENRAKNASTSPIKLATDPNVTVDVVVTDGQYCEGGSLEITVSYPHKVFMPFMSQFIGEFVNLDAVVTDTILTPICP